MKKYLYMFTILFVIPFSVYSQVFCIKTTDNRAAWDTSDVNNKHWEDDLSTDSYYNSKGLITESYKFNVLKGEKSNYEYCKYEYNEFDNITLWKRDRFIDGEWKDYYKRDYTYIQVGDKQLVSSMTEYMTDGTGLKPSQKKEYIYYELGKIDTVLFYNYINGFVLSTISKYEYNDKYLLDNIIEYTNYDNVLEPTRKTGYTYNDKDLLIIQSDSNYISNSWYPVERVLYDYYPNNDLLKYTIWQNYYDNGVYWNFKRYTEFYHENGLQDLQTHALARTDDNSIFQLNSQFRWEYDENWHNTATYYDTYLDSVLYYDTKYYTLSVSGVNDEKPSIQEGQVYPNPADDFIMLKNLSYDKAQLVDINGKVVRDNIENASSINTNGLVPGTYFLRAFKGNNVNDIQFVISK